MLNKTILFFISFISAWWQLPAQTIYSIDASKVRTEIKSGYFKMGNPGPEGKQLLVNSRYLTIHGEPQIPVMGELQYSRMPQERWKDEILKMKAGGVTIIATYSFWNHHEEIEGKFDWSGNKDLRSFVKLCQQLGVYVYPRIGPWSHGEGRNGGTPDWILRKKYITDRSLDPVYKEYVDRYFRQIGLQLKGLIYKDGGPVIGIQIENEYWKGKEGEPYIYWLKQTALKYGMDVPLYTVTGWGDGSVPLNEVIPLWGGYPDESWTPNIEKITSCNNYTFNSFRDDETIGNAQVKKKDKYMDYSLDPYFTCEMGVGIFNSIHRRPVIGKLDGLGLIVSRIGSGGNLLGYYVFAGGSQPLGIYSTMEENKDETGYWSELSPVSYDFQAAIKENGMLAPSYYEVKKMNYFLNEFGSILAPMEPVFVTSRDLQYAARIKGNSGFLFGINYCRNNVLTEKKQVRFRIKLKDRTLEFPSIPVNIPDSSLFIWPFNLDMDGTRLVYATAQPLCKIERPGQSLWVLVQDADLLPELSLADSGIENVTSANGYIKKVGHDYIISRLQPGTDCIIEVQKKNGLLQKILVLSREDAKDAWLLRNTKGEKLFFISRSGLYMNGDELQVTDTLPLMNVKMLTGDRLIRDTIASSENSPRVSSNRQGIFTKYTYSLPEKKLPCNYQQQGALENASWLLTSVKNIDAGNRLYHREFQKEFSAGDPSAIKSAKLILASESGCRFRINDKWCEQTITPGTLNVLDITGYINKGENVLLMDFPYTSGDKAFAARILVEYFNTNRLDFSTDASWVVSDLYYFPPVFGSKPVYPISFAAPEIAATSAIRTSLSQQWLPGFSEWTVPVSCNYLDGLNNLFLAVKYKGDRISVRLNNQLIADNLNNNTEWMMDMKRNSSQVECHDLQLEVRPWKDISKMYFDISPASTDEGKALIESIRFIPEYKVSAEIR